MVLVIDVLRVLGSSGPQSRETIANALGCEVQELEQPLRIGVQQGLIGVQEPGWSGDPAAFIGDFAIADKGGQLAEHVLERFAAQVAGPPGLSIPERFLWAIAEDQPEGTRTRLVTLAEAPRLQIVDDETERDRALVLVQAAISWAGAALNANRETQGRALGLESLDLSNLEAVGYVSQVMRDEYVVGLSGELLNVVLGAANAAESAWGLRPLAEQRGASFANLSIDGVLAREVAEYAALALVAATRLGLAQLWAEADLVSRRSLRPLPDQAA